MTATSPTGRVVRDAAGVRLQYERELPAAVDRVWDALTDRDLLARWFGRWSGDPTSGTVELVSVEAPGEQPATVRIVVCEPPTRLQVELGTLDGPWPLGVTLTDVGGPTQLRFTHELAEPYDASAIGPGWQYYLDRLEAVVAGRPVPDDFDQYHPALAPAYAVPSAPSPA